MIGALILAIILFGIQQPWLSFLKKRHSFIDVGLLNKLYGYHLVFWLIYYTYTRFNRSDSIAYFDRAENSSAESWFSLYHTGTRFIDFSAYPFVNYLGFNYEMMMQIFAWFGFIGFVYFYIFFKENNRIRVNFFGYDLITILLFLPNMHFWTASLGKGSLIFFGLGMFAYAMKEPQKRFITLIFGSFLIFNVRPHVFLFAGVGAVIGYLTSSEKVSLFQKLFVSLVFAGAIFMFYGQILAVANLNEADVVSSFEEFASTRSDGLSSSGSGVNINNYPLILKLFTFWFRPLFIDAPGALGIFVSFENLVYVLLFFKLFDKKFIGYLAKASSMVKMSAVIFITSSIALSFVMANLGIATRQKSMVMYFLFFVVLSFLSGKEQERRARVIKRKALILKKREYAIK
ncbi:hypothetical protein [Pedobacter metabolipauper]|uniref:Uncharacterized protein n=1 Tax=Pedobacter metabolipauper TaxID=425513 RepID=A0A4V3D1A7_9SPHI|nr:hypothetical protein [Pedobacter metabolipauper]TDQ09937.1 hypothetical protein ATK78_2096 [Pedobacter metabolipauper]